MKSRQAKKVMRHHHSYDQLEYKGASLQAAARQFVRDEDRARGNGPYRSQSDALDAARQAALSEHRMQYVWEPDYEAHYGTYYYGRVRPYAPRNGIVVRVNSRGQIVRRR